MTLEYLAGYVRLVGSPETLANKIRKLYNEVGGFGALLVLVYDHCRTRRDGRSPSAPWRSR